MNAYSPTRPALRMPQRPLYAPALLAAYAAGATLWAPVLVLVAKLGAGAFGWMLPTLPAASAAGMFVAMWLLRFVLYFVGVSCSFDYGYGINGVIVNRELTLADKARRISRDWFGVLLIMVWLGYAAVTLIAFVPA